MVDPRERADQLPVTVRTRRRALHLTQEQLADLAGVSLRFVHDVEHGKATVQLDRLVVLLDTLGLHLAVRAGGAPSVRAELPELP
jgi:y4mF family transcriptional regulator